MIKKQTSIKHCERDYKNKHRWERIGIDMCRIYYQCTQCHCCCFEELVVLGELKDG